MKRSGAQVDDPNGLGNTVVVKATHGSWQGTQRFWPKPHNR